MPNLLLFGKDSASIASLAKAAGFTITENKPDFVASFGGDGTLMESEHRFPGIPKIVLKNSGVCKKCSALPNEEVLRRVAAGRYAIEVMPKLEVVANQKTLIAQNDIILHNQNPRHAIRYILTVNNAPVGGEIIGDGIVVATPFGSTAYYRSITDGFFEVGIGLAFNNSTEQSDHMVLKDQSVIKIRIIRGPAVIYADNQKEEIQLTVQDEALIRLAKTKAHIVIPEI